MNYKEIKNELDEYIKGWSKPRYPIWHLFYKDVTRYRRNGIYLLKRGEDLMSLLESVFGNIENYLIVNDDETLIPSKFTTIRQFLRFMDNFSSYIKQNENLLQINMSGDYTSYIITDLLEIIDDVKELTAGCHEICMVEAEMPTPYQQAHNYLNRKEISPFISVIRSLIYNVPYGIRKKPISEAYFHTLFHAITSVLGFKPLSESETAIGRIDTVIETDSVVYILEFKYSDKEEDLSNEALDQIINTKYAEKYKTHCKQIIGIGISYAKKIRNINNFKSKTLYMPSIRRTDYKHTKSTENQ